MSPTNLSFENVFVFKELSQLSLETDHFFQGDIVGRDNVALMLLCIQLPHHVI
jgi:hypothetical protein